VSSRAVQLDCPHRLDEPENPDDALEVVCQDMQTLFGRDVTQPVRLEVGRTHPVLESAEHVPDCTASHRHCIELAIQQLTALPQAPLRAPIAGYAGNQMASIGFWIGQFGQAPLQ
jgi:hypothetical protein